MYRGKINDINNSGLLSSRDGHMIYDDHARLGILRDIVTR